MNTQGRNKKLIKKIGFPSDSTPEEIEEVTLALTSDDDTEVDYRRLDEEAFVSFQSSQEDISKLLKFFMEKKKVGMDGKRKGRKKTRNFFSFPLP